MTRIHKVSTAALFSLFEFWFEVDPVNYCISLFIISRRSRESTDLLACLTWRMFYKMVALNVFVHRMCKSPISHSPLSSL